MPAVNIPILLTSSVVAHDTSVALIDTADRLRSALESLEQWLNINPLLRIVLCDGSSFDFSKIVSEKFPLAEIECLHFENKQDLIKQYGRGYGEGEIVRYALENSKFIGESGCFAKCSSKLWVENFAQCLSAWNGNVLCKGVFLNVFTIFKKTTLSYIDTRFYIVSCATYKKYLENAHFQIDKDSAHGLEECFKNIFIKHKLENFLFNIPPVICGIGGGTGTYYKNTFTRRLKEKLRLKLARMHKKFDKFF